MGGAALGVCLCVVFVVSLAHPKIHPRCARGSPWSVSWRFAQCCTFTGKSESTAQRSLVHDSEPHPRHASGCSEPSLLKASQRMPPRVGLSTSAVYLRMATRHTHVTRAGSSK